MPVHNYNVIRTMDRNLALEFVRVTEAAAIAAAEWIGRGDKIAADKAAVDAMRSRFNQVDFAGTVVIGEGKKDEAPELYTGERLGTGRGPEMDIAVDPLEATTSVALGRSNALCVIVTGPKGSLLGAPDTGMEKLAVGPAARGVIDLDAPVDHNLRRIATALGKDINELTVMVLERDRHQKLMTQIRQAGARLRLITDGDIAAVATCFPESGVDVLMGTGGSTEGVLAAAAIKILGGEILCRFAPRKPEDEVAIREAGFSDLKKIFRASELARGGQITFTATGVIDGPLLRGVLLQSTRIVTHSMVLRGASKTLRYITAYHHGVV